MSESSHDKQKDGHGTVQSYIVGLIFSLVLTANAYYLVVSKSLSGNALLVTILGLAVLQMLVQIFFFLHLGRGPKPLYNVTFFVGTVGIIIFIVVGSIFIMNNLQYTMTPKEVIQKLAQNESIAQVGGEKTGACQTAGIRYRVTISEGKTTPATTIARLCDTLTFINEDGVTHDIMFGTQTTRVTYGGEFGVAVRKGYAKTITLNQVGSFEFHDELDQRISGKFSVGE